MSFSRRRFLLGLGWGGLGLLSLATLPGMLRFLWPRSEPSAKEVVQLGALADYAGTDVTTRWLKRHALWLVRRGNRLLALDARCTHLGCTPQWTPEQSSFLCPCHGSRFAPDGALLHGPATQPLIRLAIRVERGRVIVDRSMRASMDDAERDSRFSVPI